MGLSGLVRSEGARKEKDSRVKDIKRGVREGERDWLPLSIPIVVHGPCRLNSYANRQLKVRRDNTKPTWLPDTYLSGATAFSRASCYSWGLKVACLSALGRTVIPYKKWNSQSQCRLSSLWATVTIGGLSINYHLNACWNGEGPFEGASAD